MSHLSKYRRDEGKRNKEEKWSESRRTISICINELGDEYSTIAAAIAV